MNGLEASYLNDFEKIRQFIEQAIFHRELQCLVAIDPKIDVFKPEYLGKMEFYLEALDRDIKSPMKIQALALSCAKAKMKTW